MMSKILYEDDKCTYLDGHPSYDDRAHAHACVKLSHNKIDVILDSDPVCTFEIGLDDILHIEYARAQTFDEAHMALVDQLSMELGPLYVYGPEPPGPPATPIGHKAIVWVKDPEGILPQGMKIRFAFRNEYYSKLFIKRVDDLGLKKSYTQDKLDNAIRSHKIKHIDKYQYFVDKLKSGDVNRVKKIKKQARKLFGRNAIAEALRVRSPNMVSKSKAWRAIAKELQLEKQQGPKHIRIGMDKAVTEKSIANWNDESHLMDIELERKLDAEGTRLITEHGGLDSNDEGTARCQTEADTSADAED